MNFALFQQAVAAQWERMQKHPMFRVAVEKDHLWAAYLAAFPPGTNEVFRERREHDCNCCKQFVRAIGNVVAVIDGKLTTIWDVSVAEPGYHTVAKLVAKYVKQFPISEPFLHYEPKAGTARTFDEHLSGKAWDHFHVNIKRDFVLDKHAIPTKLSLLRSSHDVFKRSLETITDDAIQTVLDLIAQNSLYRGEEHRFAVSEFQKLKTQYNRIPAWADRELFCWTAKGPESVLRIRNTAIGTLLVDLSEGKDLDAAVREFESKVAPANYKRTTALITPAMIAKAKEKVAELGLTSALERRYATLRDITVNNVLFANRDARKNMGGDVFDDLAAGTSARAKVSDKIEEVPIAKFIADILPRVDSIEVLVENRHAGNFVSLIAPVDPTAGKLFKWDNNFSWSYAGDVADSIKERVKKAGGNVTGDLCCRLAWDNSDDLDLHLRGPGGHIYYGDKRGIRGGCLDVDANGMDGIRPNPVENIFFANKDNIAAGTYQLWVNQFSKRGDPDEKGFDAEIDFMGQVNSFSFPRRLRAGENVNIATFKYTKAGGLEIIESLPSQQASRTVWGLPTQTFHKVNVLCMSPNYWDEQGVGNRHYFFMLDGARNDGSARGFYNEFLDSRLDPHRKVFEMVGSKMRPADTPDQLSGLGFSSTQPNTLTVRVKGSYQRTINIKF